MLGRLTAPLSSLAMRSVLEPVVTSVVILRDKVEQDRFVVRWAAPACHSCGCVVLCCAVLSACSGRGMPAGAGCSHFSQPAAHAQACVLAPAGRCP